MGMSKTDFVRKAMGEMQTKKNNLIKVVDEGLRFYIERIEKKRTKYMKEAGRAFNGKF